MCFQKYLEDFYICNYKYSDFITMSIHYYFYEYERTFLSFKEWHREKKGVVEER